MVLTKGGKHGPAVEALPSPLAKKTQRRLSLPDMGNMQRHPAASNLELLRAT
ncbi:hypothetical protein DIPPA_10327 [Diplonema papillatum]|nr:hypothetical protein DIPPA_10327 [Diplonema papillatum]